MARATEIFETPELLAEAAAARFVECCKTRIADTGRCAVVLAGGSSPRAMHEILAEKYEGALEWSKVFVFIGDERFVPPDHPDSNYLMMVETLLSIVPIPEENIYPYLTEGITPEEAASLYTRELETFFKGEPVFDLVFLGMGEDGHTASLFPGFPQITEPSDDAAQAVFDAPKPPPTRLTLSLKTLNRAREVIILVSGSGKAEATRRILKDNEPLPAGKVMPVDGRLTWLLDKAAASQL